MRGAPLSLITTAIMEGKRPLTLRFMPREQWFKEIEAASYDLVYPSDQLGIQIALNPDTGLPVVIQNTLSPTHVSHGPEDLALPQIEDQVRNK